MRSVNLTSFEETYHDTPHSLVIGWRARAHRCGLRGRPSVARAAAGLCAAAATLSWTGFYAGINAGYHWGGSSYSFIGTDTDGAGLGSALGAGAILAPAAHGSNGFIGGGQIGYNYQIQSFVLGLEVDIDGATGRNSRTAFHERRPWFRADCLCQRAAARLARDSPRPARLGADRSSFDLWHRRFGVWSVPGGILGGCSNGGAPLFAFSSSSANVGWAAGGGIEYALPANWSNWSVKVEYLYYDLGRTTSSIFYAYAPNTSSVTGSIRHNGNIVRAGLNYRFNWWAPAPIVAKY